MAYTCICHFFVVSLRREKNIPIGCGPSYEHAMRGGRK